MSTKARMARDASILLVSRIGEGAIAVFFSAWTVRLVTKEELSLWPVLGVMAGIAEAVGGLGLPMASVRLVPAHLAKGEQEEAGRLLRSSLLVQTAVLLVLCGVLLAGSNLVARVMLKNELFTAAVAMLTPAVFFRALGTFLSYYLQSAGGFRQMSINLVVGGLATTATAPFLYLWLGWRGLPIALALGPFLACLLALLHLRRLVFRGRGIGDLRELLRFSSPFYATGFLAFVHGNADFLLLGVLTSPEQMAPYYVAYRVVSYLFQLSKAGMTVASRRVAELQVAGQQRVEAAFTRTLRYLFAFLLPIYVGVGGLSWPLIGLYGGSKYRQAAPILAALCGYAFVQILYEVYRLNIWVRGKPVETLRLQVVSTFLMTSLTLAGVLVWTGMGAALGQTAALAITIAIAARWLRRLMQTRYDLATLRVSSVASGAMLAVLIIPQLLSRHPAAVVVSALCGGLAYLRLIAPAIRREDADLIRGLLPGALAGPVISLLQWLGAEGERRSAPQAVTAQPAATEGTLDEATPC